MRSTKLYIIISIVVLIIVGIITSILSNQLKKGSESSDKKQIKEKVETTGTRSLSRTEKYREVSRITKQSHTSLLSDDQIKRFNKLSSDISKSQNGIINNEDFELGYSNIINLFCVQKKSPQGDIEFKKYLTEQQALDIYERDPSLFLTSEENCSSFLRKQEEYLVQDLELNEEDFSNLDESKTETATSSSNRSTDFDQIKESFSEIIQSIYDIEKLATLEGFTGLSSSGIVEPPNIGNANELGYYKMPPAPNGEYTFGGWNHCGEHSYGSKELIGAIYTAVLRWKAKYPQYEITVNDLNGRKSPAYQGHSSHGNGVDVDIVTYGNWNLQINAPTEVNIDLGKAFIDTGITKLIIIGANFSHKNVPIIHNALKEYANSKGLYLDTSASKSHDNHFHIRINDQFRLNEYRPSSPC